MLDVIIVGAGAAGIAAGRHLARHGLAFTILEASPRIGGRAFTDRTSLPGHWDHGCHWFHCADVNPLVAKAEALAWDFERKDRIGQALAFDNGRWLTPDEIDADNVVLDASVKAIYAAAAMGQDLPLTAVLSPDRPAFVDHVLRLQSSADPDKVSTLGYADYADTDVNWVVTGGLGALIERLADGLPIRTGVAVIGIAEQAGGVRLQTSAGVIEAKAAIVTASTNVLLSGAIDFAPGPARAVFDLMQDLPCGAYEKLALAFDRLPFDPKGELFCDITSATALPFGFQIVTGPTPKLIAHFGGRNARAVAAMSLADQTALAFEALAAAFGSAAPRAVTGSARTEWSASPWTRGAYSYARVGAGAVRKTMIETETGAIRFAGEAFSLPWHATVHGAWASGEAVASDLAASLTRAR